MNQVLEFKNEVNALTCYNCDKSDHITRHYLVSKKMNFKNFVKKMEKNISNQNVE